MFKRLTLLLAISVLSIGFFSSASFAATCPNLLESGQKSIDALPAGSTGQLYMKIQAPIGFGLERYVSTFSANFQPMFSVPDGTEHSVGILSGTKEALSAFVQGPHDPQIQIHSIGATATEVLAAQPTKK